jgi:hypothetical protein
MHCNKRFSETSLGCGILPMVVVLDAGCIANTHDLKSNLTDPKTFRR